LSVIAAGFVGTGGNVVRSGGGPVHVDKEATGKYHIIFDQALASVPVVVATSDGGPKGSFARITETTVNGFKIEGRDYAAHGLADIGFSFMVAKLA